LEQEREANADTNIVQSVTLLSLQDNIDEEVEMNNTLLLEEKEMLTIEKGLAEQDARKFRCKNNILSILTIMFHVRISATYCVKGSIT
jgi:hypothetical protein